MSTRERMVEAFDVRTPSTSTPASSLSGGNQQKVVVAREFSRPIELLVAAQPTRGIDVGSIEYIHSQLVAKRDAGVAVLVVSSELDEVIALADRVAVMFRGRLVGPFPTPVAKEALGLMMAGVSPDEAMGGGPHESVTRSARRGSALTTSELTERSMTQRIVAAITGADVRLTVLAFVAAFGVGAVFLALSDSRTLDAIERGAGLGPTLQAAGRAISRAYGALLQGSLGSGGALSETLVAATVLILTGLAVTIPLRAGLFNIGGEGQVIAGARRRLRRLRRRGSAAGHPPAARDRGRDRRRGRHRLGPRRAEGPDGRA
jgi:energy-coupling factor transporter ATP-binding protein EcfA2